MHETRLDIPQILSRLPLFQELAPEIRRDLTVHLVETMDEVLPLALVDGGKRATSGRSARGRTGRKGKSPARPN